MKKSFKQVAREELESVVLTSKQLDELMGMQYSHAKISPPRQPSGKVWYQIAGMIAVLLFSAAGVVQYSKHHSRSLLIQRIASEVAGSHLKMKPMQVAATNISDVQEHFNKLTFFPRASEKLESNPQVALAGGRYCSIQGVTAAQLRYKNRQGGYVTLFETPSNARLFKALPNIDKGDQPLVTYAEGVKVTMWIEKGLLMVSTEEATE